MPPLRLFRVSDPTYSGGLVTFTGNTSAPFVKAFARICDLTSSTTEYNPKLSPWEDPGSPQEFFPTMVQNWTFSFSIQGWQPGSKHAFVVWYMFPATGQFINEPKV